MSRRGRGKPQAGISLFPFLAVLICTMGALIVLLLMLVQHAKVDAHAKVHVNATSFEPPKIDENALRQRIEDAEWRRQLLEEQRLEQAKLLSERRLELAHLEEHIRTLQDQWSDLEAQSAQLVGQGDTKDKTRQRVADEMSQLAAQIDKAKRDLAAARASAAAKPKSYSIIPYEGPNGTSRRPIYIECTEDAVIIQPEGFVLTAADFTGPMGPGNPLDACLRAVREYLARDPEFSKHGEPYPLLIVRPAGVFSYSFARAAMKSWDDEFGYELVEDDTQLAYPPPDERLKLILQRAVQDARRRQERLALAAPSQYRGKAFGDGGDGDGYGAGPGESAAGGASSGKLGGGRGGGSFSAMADIPDFGEDGAGSYAPTRQPGSGSGYSATRPRGDGYGTTPQRGAGGEGRGQSGGAYEPGAQRRQGGNVAGPAGSAHGKTGEDGVASSGPSKAGTRPSGSNAGANGGSPDGDSTAFNPGGSSGQAGEPAEGDPSAGPNLSINANQKKSKPLAAKKGANWGLPNYSDKATGITRPIRVRLEADRLLLMRERGDRRPARAVPIDGALDTATENLVAEIWNEVDTWGIAVRNGYWKPVLSVEVPPGQDAAFEELQTLLDGSGLEVRRRAP